MDNPKTCTLKLIGRVLLSIIFIVAGWGKIAGFEGTALYVATALPFPEVITALVIIIELGGGLMLLLGWKTKFAAWTLAIFTLAAAGIFHSNLADPMQSGQFMKNLAIAGGMLYVAAVGAGRYSLDTRLGKKKAAAPTA